MNWIVLVCNPGIRCAFSGLRLLHESNVVSAGFWNTFVSVDVVPDVDVVITTERRGSRKLLPILLIALLVIVVAAAMAVAFRG